LGILKKETINSQKINEIAKTDIEIQQYSAHKNLNATTLINASKAPTIKIVLYPSRCMVIIKNLAANVMNQRLVIL
jgi:hypothetical protein